MAIIKKTAITSCSKDMIQLKLPYIADKDVKWYNHFGKQFGCSSKVEQATLTELLPGECREKCGSSHSFYLASQVHCPKPGIICEF